MPHVANKRFMPNGDNQQCHSVKKSVKGKISRLNPYISSQVMERSSSPSSSTSSLLEVEEENNSPVNDNEYHRSEDCYSDQYLRLREFVTDEEESYYFEEMSRPSSHQGNLLII